MNPLLMFAASLVTCSTPKTIAPFFHEIAYESFPSAASIVRSIEQHPKLFFRGGCSGLRVGDFHGRNMDWTIDTKNYYLVRVSAKPDRLASMGVAMAFYGDDRELLPWVMMDGINSKGVAVQVNVVPTGDCGITVSTKPGAPRLATPMVVRYLLDRAESAAGAVELIRGVDLFGNGKNELHWMISDERTSYVVEVVSNSVRAIEHPLITNFYVTESPYAKKGGAFTKGAAGIERYERLRRWLGKVKTHEDMLSAMKEEWYTNAYRPGVESAWWSEFNGIEWTDPDTGRKWSFAQDDGGEGHPESEAHRARMKYLRGIQPKFAMEMKAERETGVRNDLSYWMTVESECYDLRNRRLYIRMHERDPLFSFELLQ